MASQNIFKRYKNMQVQVKDLTASGDVAVTGNLTVTGTTISAGDYALNDDDSLVVGTGLDAELLWSTADASNHAAVLALGDSNQSLHVTDVGAKATDWNVSADTHPTVYVHSNTTPATDYITVGPHDGTIGHVNVVGGTTLSLDIAGTAEATLTATVLDLASADLQMQASGQILDNNGNELIEFLETASAVNGLRIVNAATGNNPIITNEGEADTGITIAGYDGSNTEEICEFDAVATAINGWKMSSAASGAIARFGSNGTGAAADTGFELVDSNGNEVLEAVATASAVNGLRIVNSATGVKPIITNEGEVDTGITLANYDGTNTEEILVLVGTPTATNGIRIVNNTTGLNPIITNEGEVDTGITLAGYDGTNTEEILILDAVATAVNEFTVTNAAAGNPVLIAATGGDTDVGIGIASKGAGYARVTTGGFQVHSTAAVTATADGLTTGLIPQGTSFVVVTSANADHIINFPISTVGDRMRVLIPATGCELRSVVAGHLVNNVVVGATNEAALTAENLYDCQYVAANKWVVIGYTKLGAVQAALVPDAV